MAANTKYSPAPQRDSFEDTENYTQAPPSYQAESSRFNESLLTGAPRNSDDNIPDDFKFGGTVAEATIDIRMKFVRKVYAILTTQILATAALSSVSFFNASYKTWIQSNSFMVIAAMVLSFVFMFLAWWKSRSYPANLIFLTGFTVCEAYAISVIVTFYESRLVLQALILTLGIFLALTLFACQVKYDFTSWGPWLFGLLWGLVMFGFVAMFFPYNSTVELCYSGIAALIFSAYIIFDTQNIMRHYHVEDEIPAAISLYLDVINLFLAILRILNSQQNN
ncbi:MAG: hypothetical protein M1829_002248 [Trizodia sp. TS-e1964]|nr:MAG: hypothetical protein M1829_002248 [Trizodia sp. TS-e1964]